MFVEKIISNSKKRKEERKNYTFNQLPNIYENKVKENSPYLNLSAYNDDDFHYSRSKLLEMELVVFLVDLSDSCKMCSSVYPLRHWHISVKNNATQLVQKLPELRVKKCDNCHLPASKLCSKCKFAWYCSPNCQLAAFPLHQYECMQNFTKFNETATFLAQKNQQQITIPDFLNNNSNHSQFQLCNDNGEDQKFATEKENSKEESKKNISYETQSVLQSKEIESWSTLQTQTTAKQTLSNEVEQTKALKSVELNETSPESSILPNSKFSSSFIISSSETSQFVGIAETDLTRFRLNLNQTYNLMPLFFEDVADRKRIVFHMCNKGIIII